MRSRITFRLLLIGSFALLAVLNTVANVWADTPEPQKSGDALIEPLTLQAGRASDYRFIGESRDRLGAGLAFGDLDGDGQGDLIIGVPGASVPDTVEPQTGYEAGAIWAPYTVFHPDTLPYSGYVITVFASADLVAYGAGQYHRVGSALAVGDLNDDGYVDLVIGNPNNFEGYFTDRIGAVHILYGPVEFDEGFIADKAGRTYVGTSERHIGLRVAVGDLNNDGIDDLAMSGQPSESFRQGGIEIFFGPIESGATGPLGDPDVAILRADINQQVGATLAIGDLSGDNADDLVIGMPSARGGGQIFLGFGPLAAGTIQLDDMLGIPMFGGKDNRALGTAFAIGDLNGDGWNDLVTSDPLATIGDDTDKGAVYVFRGPIGPLDQVLVSLADVVIEGDAARNRLGSSLVVADLDNDGVQDLVIGADELDVRGQDNAGMVYLLIGDVFTPKTAFDSDFGFSPIRRPESVGEAVTTIAYILATLGAITVWLAIPLAILGALGIVVVLGVWVVYHSPPLLGGGNPDHKDDPDSRRWF